MNELREGFQVTPAVRLLRPIGQGGMGKVWVAEHTGLKTEVVVKFMAPPNDADSADMAARFDREAAIATSVKSPHVVQMLDHGITGDDVRYIVMEKLEGHDLAEHLHQNGPMPPRDVAALVLQVAKALGRAHAQGVIHRDIKPENIFLCDQADGELFVKVLDFGIAKSTQLVQSTSTVTGHVVGTPYYMSPEQIVGDHRLDSRTDIWSLGVVAFEALTGKRPFEGATVGAITLALHTTKPRITALKPELPRSLDDWFARVCCHNAEGRFDTAREAANALFEALGEANPHGSAIMRPPAQSDPMIPIGVPSSGPERAVTSLSTSFHVAGAPRKPSTAMLAAAGAAIVALAIVAVIALRGSSSSDDKSNATTPPVVESATASATATATASAIATATPTETATTAPTASATETPVASAKPPRARPGVATKPGTVVRPVKRPNDDDIK